MEEMSISDDVIKDLIFEYARGGVKKVKLVVEVLLNLHNIKDVVSIDIENRITTILRDMVEDGDLIEVEYTLPDMPYRLKTFYLPKGSKIIRVDGLTIDHVCDDQQNLIQNQ